jgi:hypothetical protein
LYLLSEETASDAKGGKRLPGVFASKTEGT